MSLKSKIVVVLSFFILLIIGFKKVVDYQDYNPTVIIETNNFEHQDVKELLKGNKINSQFIAKNNNLGIVSILFDTYSRTNSDYLRFSIKEVISNKWYYSNKYKVDKFGDHEYFPFGFPEITNLKGKKYQIEIESLDGIEANSVQIVDSVPFLSKYNFSKMYLMEHKNEIPIFF